jgi:IS30 family transposase
MSQLSLSERYEIFAFKKQGICNSEIAKTLGRDKSTRSRELKRKADGRSKNYRPDLAHRKAADRHLHKNKHKDFTVQVQEDIIYWLEKDFSPDK